MEARWICRLARTSRTPLQRGAVSICTLALRYSCASLHPCRECLLVRGRASAGWSRQSLWWRIRRQFWTHPANRVPLTVRACRSLEQRMSPVSLNKKRTRATQQTTNHIAAVQTLAVTRGVLSSIARRGNNMQMPFQNPDTSSLWINPVLQYSKQLFEYFSTERIFKRPLKLIIPSFL